MVFVERRASDGFLTATQADKCVLMKPSFLIHVASVPDYRQFPPAIRARIIRHLFLALPRSLQSLIPIHTFRLRLLGKSKCPSGGQTVWVSGVQVNRTENLVIVNRTA